MTLRNKQPLILKPDDNSDIRIIRIDDEHYMSLTDMVKNYGGTAVVAKWLSSKDTVEFLGVWEQLNNPDFNSPEFELIKSEAGTQIMNVE